jgi:hypothetical protein
MNRDKRTLFFYEFATRKTFPLVSLILRLIRNKKCNSRSFAQHEARGLPFSAKETHPLLPGSELPEGPVPQEKCHSRPADDSTAYQVLGRALLSHCFFRFPLHQIYARTVDVG